MKTLYSDDYQRFISLLRDARTTADLSQTELADQLGRPQSFVSKYERAERRLDVIEFMEVCRLLGIDPCEIIHKLDRRGRRGVKT